MVFRKHYSIRPFSEDNLTISGKMKIEFSWLIKLMSPILKLFNLLVIHEGEDIPVIICLHNNLHSRAFYFERIFYFPNKCYNFNSYMEYQQKNEVIEYTKLGIGLRIYFLHQDGKILLKHQGYVCKIFRWVIPLPISWLAGKVSLEKEPISEEAFHLKMEVTHPLFGIVYRYSGKFHFRHG